jgi:hypothetical protein
VLRGDVALNVLGPDSIERLAGEERPYVVPQIRGDRQSVRLTPAPKLEALTELGPRLLDRHALAVWRRAWAVDLPHPAQHSLRLRFRQPVGAALGAGGTNLALHAPAVRPVPRGEPGAADYPQRARPVGPSTRRSSCAQPTARIWAGEFCV